MDQSGNAYVSGYTMSTDFLVKNAPSPNLQGETDAFVTKIRNDGLALVFSTYLGGLGTEHGYALAVDKAGNAYVTAVTSSNDFPTKNPLFPMADNMNAFVTKIGVQDITPIIMDLLLVD